MDREAKQKVVEHLTGVFASAGSVVFAHYAGLDAAAMTALRRQVRGAGGKMVVAKNSLSRRAVVAAGGDAEVSERLLRGPVALAWAEDPLVAPKVMVSFAKEDESLAVVGGWMDGEGMEVGVVENLAAAPSMDEIRGQIVQLLVTPARRIVQLSREPATRLVQVTQARKGE